MKKVVLILLLLAVVVAATLSGCRSGDGKTILTVYNWGEYISRESDTIAWRGREYEIKDVIAEFEAAYPQYKVNYQTYDDNEKMYAKLDTESYDILVPSDYMVVRLIKEGRLQELDQSRLPNVKKYLDRRLDNLTYDSDQALSDKVSNYAVPICIAPSTALQPEKLLPSMPTTQRRSGISFLIRLWTAESACTVACASQSVLR